MSPSGDENSRDWGAKDRFDGYNNNKYYNGYNNYHFNYGYNNNNYNNCDYNLIIKGLFELNSNKTKFREIRETLMTDAYHKVKAYIK